MMQGYPSRKVLEDRVRSGMRYQRIEILRVLWLALFSGIDSSVPVPQRQTRFA